VEITEKRTKGLYLFISLKNIIDLKAGESLTDEFLKISIYLSLI